MKKYFFILLIAFTFCVQANAQFKPVDASSKISFVIKNMGIDVDGTLKGLKGTLQFDPKNIKASAIDVTVDVATINTDNTKRDNHLKQSDFFDADKYPQASIKTTQISSKGGDVYFAKAILTMHGISKNIQFDFIAKPQNNGYLFTGGFSINRLDYKIGGSSITMADNVKVSLYVVGSK